jgi:phenylacetate-CoA ligase
MEMLLTLIPGVEGQVTDTRMYVETYSKLIFPFYETLLRNRSTLKYLAQLEKNQWLTEEELRVIQLMKLQLLLNHAYENVPFYRKRFKERGIRPGDIRTPRDFLDVPMLSKSDINRNRDELIAVNFARKKMYNSWTGGSTGFPIEFKYDRSSYEWRVASAARADRWTGWNSGEKELYIWGVRPSSESAMTRFKKKIHHRSLRRKIINSYTFSKETLPVYVREYNHFRPRVVVGYATPLYNFAKFVKSNSLECHSPKAIIVTAEKSYPYQRTFIEEVFNTKVYNRYGCREVMLIAAECETQEGLHMNIDNLYIEILRNGEPVGPGEIGEVAITDLNNYGMPFIRYMVGDLAILSEHKCSCGRGLPLLEDPEGRVMDTVVTADGRFVTGLFFTHLMKDFSDIRQFQVIQETQRDIIIKIVTNGQIADGTLIKIKEEVYGILGNYMKLSFQLVNEIPLETSGKRRIVISKLPVDFGNG